MEPLEGLLKLLDRYFGENVRVVLLFGSRTRGLASPGSDYDILVLVEGDKSGGREFWRELFKLELELGVSFDVIILREEEVSADNPLLWGILTGYRVLRGEEHWERMLKRLRKDIRKRKPRLIEGDKQWQIAQLV
ncbi:nucleotidyltransferase domain-containing protein [Thermococcus indicus]|nr:nucleotidyltransferase domain-containing protein [Thermococcus indicus]